MIMEMQNVFLPSGYDIPKESEGFFKFEQGINKFRVLPSGVESDCLVGYEYFTQGGAPQKVYRSKTKFTSTPYIKSDSIVKPFWAFKIYNYNTNEIEICKITQTSIMKSLISYLNHEDYGSPLNYDITITKEGEKLLTDYKVIVGVPKAFTIPVEDKQVDWEAYFRCEKDVWKRGDSLPGDENF